MTFSPEPDVVAASVATYSDHVDLFEAFSAQAAAGTFADFAALLAPGSTVLDAGCGPGRDLARLDALGHRAVGLDLNVDFAGKARRHGPVVLGDLRALPLRSGSFDAVWASASLIHLPVQAAAQVLRQLHRVARPGAPLHVSVRITGTTGWAEDVPMGRRWFCIWSIPEFTDAVDQAGFSVEDVTPDRGWVSVRARTRPS
jgi:SAM-dependent methyltransferase